MDEDRYMPYRTEYVSPQEWRVLDHFTGKDVRPSAADSFDMGSEANADKFADLMNERYARMVR